MTISNSVSLKDHFKTLTFAARESGKIIRDHFGKQKDIMFKGRINPVTNVDLLSEETIIEIIKSRYPDHDIITEESQIELAGSPYRWIIDPLDGTVNYSHDYPVCAVSIALEINGTIEMGVVFNPIRGEFFHAVRGQGAYLNDQPIRVSNVDTLEKSLLATGFPYDIRERRNNNLAQFNHLMMEAEGIRRDGSAALNLACTAMGRIEGYWEITISPWDIAAGILLVKEAGGEVTDLENRNLSIYKNQIVATNGLIHSELMEELQKVQVSEKDG
ncbi:MAG: inositol monophosphatase family protein [Candidatus Latescibacterota bacterium]